MGNRKRGRSRCPRAGKTKFRTFNHALKVCQRLEDEGHPYRCPFCGFYHITSIDEAEYNRRRAAHMTKPEVA